MNADNADKEYFVLTKNDLCKGLDTALTEWAVAAPIRKRESKRELYDYISDSSEIVWEYRPTVLPLKKFFFPQDDVLLEFDKVSQSVKPKKIEANSLAIFGAPPCDLNGLKLLTEAFADDHGDPNYLARLDKALLIGLDCKRKCDENAFCFKVNAHNAWLGSYDAMLYEGEDDSYLLSLTTEKGKKFFDKYFIKQKTNGAEFMKFAVEKEAVFGKEQQFSGLYDFPKMFEKNKAHPIWDQEGNKCLSCGSCVMVCPTCYCFDVKDELNLGLKEGERIRKWDACMLDSFAVVAGGENFRATASKRLHHRINRKFNYLFIKHGESTCVGCGRCVRACLADISPKKIAEAIIETSIEEKSEGGL